MVTVTGCIRQALLLLARRYSKAYACHAAAFANRMMFKT
jgi:hypothetical protein